MEWEHYEGTDKASKLMQPRYSVQSHKLLKAGSEYRAKMRETVPGMFDF